MGDASEILIGVIDATDERVRTASESLFGAGYGEALRVIATTPPAHGEERTVA